MTYLLAGLIVFFGVHLLPAAPRLRARLLAKLGAGGYKAAFSLTAAAGLALLVAGMAWSPRIDLWRPPAWSAGAAAALMAPAFILFAAANFRCRIKRLARHPMSLGVLLWAAGHLLANGELASLLLFGGFAAFALFDIVRPRAPAAGTDAPASKTETAAPAAKWDAVAIGIGVAAYIALAALHRPLFGAAIFPLF